MLTHEDFAGPWAGLPVAWTENDEFDEQTYRADVARCCRAGVPGVYTGGTTGEFYAMEFEEFKAVARATVEECRAHGTPVMVGCTSTYTLGAVRRAAYAAGIGADAVQVALPFWMEVDDRQVVSFFEAVASAAPGLKLSIYETTRSKKALTVDQHQAIKEAVPEYSMVKANAGTAGCTPQGCEALSRFVRVFVSEDLWPSLGPRGAAGACSALVYYNPRVVLALWEMLKQKDWEGLAEACRPIERLHEFLAGQYGSRGFTDTAYDRMGGAAGGFLRAGLRSRGPYPSATEADVERLRQWYRENFPEMLIL